VPIYSTLSAVASSIRDTAAAVSIAEAASRRRGVEALRIDQRGDVRDFTVPPEKPLGSGGRSAR